MKIFDVIYEALGINFVLESFKKDKNAQIDMTISDEKKEYHTDKIQPVKFDYTPQTLSEYIGQENAKLRIQTYVKKIKQIKPVHLIISGTRGCGKSTLCYIIAKMLGIEIDTYVGGSFTIDNLHDFLKRNAEDKVFRILFIDEIHGISREVSEYMLPLLQSFLLPIGNQKVKPFIMMGATTNLEILQKTSQPFLDRCDLIELENYDSSNIKEILVQYNDRLYKKNLSNDAFDLISKNTRFNPRTSLSVFDDVIIEENVENVLKSRQIIKDGLTTKDILVLRHLAEIGKPVGIEVLAVITNTTRENYKELVEPFLLSQGYISRTSRGRLITTKGKQILESI
jgi:Holliday junction DNA helicase RuvB